MYFSNEFLCNPSGNTFCAKMCQYRALLYQNCVQTVPILGYTVPNYRKLRLFARLWHSLAQYWRSIAQYGHSLL